MQCTITSWRIIYHWDICLYISDITCSSCMLGHYLIFLHTVIKHLNYTSHEQLKGEVQPTDLQNPLILTLQFLAVGTP